MDYGQKIAELRKGKKLTQAELGAQLNITAQAVSKWENNLSEPDIASIQKMCQIFEISIDEFIGNGEVASTKTVVETKAPAPTPAPAPVKIINGYCNKCKKPVGPGEYKISYLAYNPGALTNKISAVHEQRIYCNDCHKFITDLQKKEQQQKVESEKKVAEDTSKSNVKKGLLWGMFASIITAIILFIVYFTQKDTLLLVAACVCTVGAFTLTSEMFWDCYVSDVFSFFCRSFRAPFGFIFELSLDGIVWLLTVKLAMWIICGLLSVAFFIFGLILSMALSIVSFPFIIAYVTKNKTALSDL